MKFEDFLMEKHAEQYIGTKDSMVDDFSDWLCDLDTDDWLRYGDLFAHQALIKARIEEIQRCFPGDNETNNERISQLKEEKDGK